MGNVKISAFSSQPDLSLIDGLAGYEGTVGNYTNARISGTEMQTWLQNNLNFATASGTINTLAMFTSASGVGDSIMTQGLTGSASVIGIDTTQTSSKLQVFTNDRSTGISSSVNWTSGAAFTDYKGISGTSGSNAGSPNWTNTGVYGQASRSNTRNTGTRGVGGSLTPGTSNLGTNYGGWFSAQEGDNNYSLRLEDGTELAGKFLKCITADGEANWGVVPQGVASLSIGTAAISTGNSLTVNTVSEAATLTPHYYAGGANIGYVPAGGDNTKFLRGDGTWAAPTGTTPNIEAVLDASTSGSRPYYGGENCIYLGAQNAIGVTYPLTSANQGRLVLANTVGTAFREFDLNGSYSALGSWVHTGTYFGWNASHVASWSPGSGYPAIELKNGRSNVPASDASTVRIAALGTATGAQLLLESANDFVFKLPSAPATGQVLAAIDSSGKVAWANNGSSYTLPAAAKDTLGGLSLKYDAETSAITFETLQTAASRFYAINLDSNDHAYVNVPWTDTNSTYTITTSQSSGGSNTDPNLRLIEGGTSNFSDIKMDGAGPITVTRDSSFPSTYIQWDINSFTGSAKGAVPSAAVGDAGKFLKADGSWDTPTNTGLTSVGLVMTSIPGFSVTGSPLTSNGDITVAPTGGTSGQYLDYQGNWDTPANTTYTAGQGISIVGTTISVATTGTIEVGDLKVDGKIENGTGVDLDIDSTEDIKIDAAKDIDVTAVGNTTGVTVNTDKAVTVNSKEAISLDVKNTATTATPVNVQPRRGGALVVHGDTTGTAADGSITLNCSADTHGVTIKSPPHSAAATYTLVLPTSAGSNTEVLQTDGSGNTSWVAQANTTYAISSVTDGSNVDIVLTAGSGGTNSTVQLTAGTGISLSQTGGNNVEIAASGSSGGGFPSAVTASSATPLLTAVDTLYTVTTTSGVADIVVSLPTAVGNSAKIIGVKYAGQNSVNDTVVIKTLSNQTIDKTNRTTNGLPLASVGTYFELISDGSNWWIK
jgi:hypothetical protein